MKFLLDTHIFLWFLEGNTSLSNRVRSIIEDINNDIYFSCTSYWEICIKISIGKLDLVDNWQAVFDAKMAENRIQWLDITKDHLQRVIDLPWHHRDPFDRLLIAQALSDNLWIATADPAFSAYGIDVISNRNIPE